MRYHSHMNHYPNYESLMFKGSEGKNGILQTSLIVTKCERV